MKLFSFYVYFVKLAFERSELIFLLFLIFLVLHKLSAKRREAAAGIKVFYSALNIIGLSIKLLKGY